MSDYLDQIEERAEDAQRNREMYSKDSWSDVEEYAEAPEAIADAVLALFNGKTEQEVREEVAAEIEARANTHIELADRFGGYYQGMRSGLQEAAKLARGGER